MTHEEGLLSPADEGQRLHISHLVAEVGNNGVGPDSWQDLVENIRETYKKARETSQPLTICYAGLYDIIVYPGGTFSLIPNNLVKYNVP